MLTAVTFMTDKVDERQVGTVTATRAEGIVWAWSQSYTLPLPVLFDLECGPSGVFKRGDMFGGETPSVMVVN